jgi:hypothetical protein
MRTHLPFVLALSVTCSGCDHLWVRDTHVTTRVGAFPDCVRAALREVNIEVGVAADNGQPALVGSDSHGHFMVRLSSPRLENADDLLVYARGLGPEPTGTVDAEIRNNLSVISDDIGRKCGNG